MIKELQDKAREKYRLSSMTYKCIDDIVSETALAVCDELLNRKVRMGGRMFSQEAILLDDVDNLKQEIKDNE